MRTLVNNPPTDLVDAPASIGARTPTVIELAWDVSPRALIASAPAAALLNGHAKKLLSCKLVWRVVIAGPGPAIAHAWLDLAMTGDEHDRLALSPANGEIVQCLAHPAGSLVSLDCGDRLRASIITSGESARVLYARSSVLGAALGLPGGVYDAPACIGR